MKHSLVLMMLCYLLASQSAIAQDLPPGFKNWLTLGTDLRASKKFTINLSEMTSFDTKPNYNLQFFQFTVGGEYELAKHTDLELGWEPFLYRNDAGFTLVQKLYGGVTFRRILGLPLKHNIEAEYFIPQQKKHRIRLNYALSYSLKNKFMPWRGRPFVKGQVMYYLGGKPLTYYDSEKEVAAYHAPNDFHRFRFTGGVAMHPTKKLDFTLYYLWNKEFNTPFTNNRDLNVPSKNGSKIKYPFNNYSVVGASLRYDIKLYSNGKHKSQKKHHRRRH